LVGKRLEIAMYSSWAVVGAVLAAAKDGIIAISGMDEVNFKKLRLFMGYPLSTTYIAYLTI